MKDSAGVQCFLTDHLGSVVATLDGAGTLTSQQRYLPFGEARLTIGTLYTDRLFTGQRDMAGLGVYHYGARFYSPKLGRFLSADTIVPGYANPQNLNRYSYVNNSPLMYTDPTGHELNETQGNGGCSTSGFCPRDYDFTPEPEEDGDGGGGGGGGGGGKPEDNPKQEDDCPDYSVCVDLSSDWVKNYWDVNRDYLNDMGILTNILGWLDLGLTVTGALTYLKTMGAQSSFFTYASTALVASAVVATAPMTVGAIAIGAAIGLGIGLLMLNASNNNLQTINDNLVDSGALTTGARIIASPTEVNIITPNGTTPVPSLFVGEFTLLVWSELHLEAH